MRASSNDILIIKHGALGDMILATGPMKAIRQHHPDATITLLTQPFFATLMQDCSFIDRIETDTRPKWWKLARSLPLIRQLRARHYDWVYDLQTSSRSSLYQRIIPHAHWSGIAKGASHRHDTPHRTTSHTIDRQKEQLAIAGITEVPPPDISWMGDTLPPRDNIPYALIVPGGSAHRPEKRWPVEHFAKLAEALLAKGITPIILGSKAEADICAQLAEGNTQIVDLCDQATLPQIAELARHAAYAIGNDTGPMHLAAAAGCRSVVLFNTQASNPELCAPRGSHVTILARPDLTELSAQTVMESL